MKVFKSVAVTALLACTAHAATDSQSYSYLSNGADWPLINAEGFQCHETNQSPIDLRTTDHSTPFTEADGYEFTYKYTNFQAAKIKNLGKTIQVDLPDMTADNCFMSEHSRDNLGGPLEFKAAQFHFHSASEHTINGKHYDFEMHTVHSPDEAKGGDVTIIASAVGLIFDREDFDPSVTTEERAIIDAFFDSMNFGNLPPFDEAKDHVLGTNVDIPYGDLMNINKFHNRWVYTGSLTTPPCSVGVYFQVVDRVLPISQRHYDLYKAQQREYLQTVYQVPSDGETGFADENIATPRRLSETGNYRVTMPIDNHNVVYMRGAAKPAEAEGGMPRLTRATTVMGVLFGIGLIIVMVLVVAVVKFNRTIGDTTMKEGGQEEKDSAISGKVQPALEMVQQ